VTQRDARRICGGRFCLLEADCISNCCYAALGVPDGELRRVPARHWSGVGRAESRRVIEITRSAPDLSKGQAERLGEQVFRTGLASAAVERHDRSSVPCFTVPWTGPSPSE